MVAWMQVAKKAAPEWLKNRIKLLLGSGSLYQHNSFEVLAAWPEVTQAQNWAQPSVIRRYVNDFRQFDVESSLKNPIVQENLRVLSEIDLPKASILDIGCASGQYHALLKAYPPTRNWEYCGVDLSPDLIEFCRVEHPGGRFEVITDSPTLPIKDGEFDVVLASGVLFAIHHPAPFLRELHRVTSNFALVSRQPVWKYRPTQVLMQRVIYAGQREEHPVRFFNVGALAIAFSDVGFEIVSDDYSEICHHVPGIAEPAIDHYYLLRKRSS